MSNPELGLGYHRKNKMKEIVKYELLKDGQGLLAYFHGQGDLMYYHIHSNELTDLEVWIKGLLEKGLDFSTPFIFHRQ